MKKIGRVISIGSLLAASLLGGCQTANRTSTAPPVQPEKNARATWSNGYALLYDLMTNEQDVSKLRFFKHEQPDVKELINRIAAASGDAAKQLKAFDAEDGGSDLKDQELPPGEQTTRDAIASTKKWDLLGHTGEHFELSLLLTQSEAMNYGWHLAEVAGKNDSRPERAKYLAGLSNQMKGFYQEIYAMLLTRIKEGPESSGAK
jgi:hypothetical protein